MKILQNVHETLVVVLGSILLHSVMHSVRHVIQKDDDDDDDDDDD